MKRILYIRLIYIVVAAILFSTTTKVYAQLVVTASQPATTLVNTLTGGAVTTYGATLTCPGVAEGTFTATGTLLSMTSGIILTNGHAAACAGAEGPLVSFNLGAPGDPAMAAFLPAGTTIVDACILEFNIVATGDTLSFNYQFGSEEYRNAVCSIYTDVFAFFISGPGITGTVNMALVPGTNIPVEINSVNNGTPGYVGGANIANCHALGAGSPFTSYYIDNTGGTQLTYRGYTQKFRAFHAVTSCDTYHLKLSIVDAGNGQYDSGVFLEAASLTTGGSTHFNHTATVGSTINGIPNSIVKGCSNATVDVIKTPSSTSTSTIHLSYTGTAVHGTDFTGPDSVTMPAGDTSIAFNISGIPTPPGGSKTIVIHLTSGCGGVDSLVINVMDTPTANILTPDTSICGASVLIRTTGSTGLTYSWTPTTGLSSSTVPQPTATPTATTTYTMTASLPGSGCPPIIRTVTISVGSIGITIGADTTICLGNSVTLLVGGSPTFSYNWSPGTGLSSTTAQDPVATPSVTTTYTVTATLPGSGCGSSVQHITVSVVSINDSILTQDTTICSGSSFTIRTTGTPGISYSWAPSSGLSNASIAEPVASPTVTTTYVLTGSLPGCPSVIRNLTVDVVSTSIGMITPNDTLCQPGASVHLVVSGSTSYNYNWAPATGLSSTTVQDPVATPTVTTTYTVTSSLAGGICPSSATVSIVILNIAPISMITPNTSICLGDTVQIQVNGSPTLIYNWTPTTGLNNPNIQDPVAVDSATTTYTVTATGPGGVCPSSASITISVNQINATLLSPDTGVCVGKSVQLDIAGDPSYVYSWAPSSGLSNPNIQDPVATPASTTTYSFTVTNPLAGGCMKQGAVTIVVGVPISPWIINPVLQYCQYFPADSLSADVHGYNLMWYNHYSDSIGSTTAPLPPTDQLGTFMYYVSQNIDYCGSMLSTIVVNVIVCCDGPIFIPTSFTPNNDGLNDYFTIKRPPHMAIDEFKVFDRWGNMVFSGNSTNDKWDGTYLGKPCELDTYYYILSLSCSDGGNAIWKKGDVTLIR